MKNLLLIDNSLSVNFWAKAIDTVNYLYNQLPIKHKGLSLSQKRNRQIQGKTWSIYGFLEVR